MSKNKDIKDLLIMISGLIGAGKTTFAQDLGKYLEVPIFYEPVTNNPYLVNFYADQKAYGFPMQIWLLNKRFHQHQQMIWTTTGAVCDRSIYEDVIFADMLHDAGNITDLDYETYIGIFETVTRALKVPDILIHLDVDPKEAHRRVVQERKRDCELGLPLEYLINLNEYYEKHIKRISKTIPVLRLKWNEFKDIKDVVHIIDKCYLKSGIYNIRDLKFEV
jgi:deoxyadenosine/deoxycytidine kinase